MSNESITYEELLNKDDFMHKVKMGKEQIYNIKMNDINFLSFLCDNAFSSEVSSLSRRCINAINIPKGVIAKFLLKESSLFEAYFSSFSQSTTYRMWALTSVLSHFLSSFPDDVSQLLNNSDVILPTLLHHLQESFVQDFFYQINELDPKMTTKLFSAILRVLCSKEVLDEHLSSIIKKSFIDERKTDLIPICLNFLHPKYVSTDVSSSFEILVLSHPTKVLKLAKNISRNDAISKYCINLCCEDSPFTQTKVEALNYLAAFPSINCTKIVKNIKNHFFSEKINSMLHCAVVKFIKASLDINDLKKAIIQFFENDVQKACIAHNKENILLIGHCYTISQELNRFIKSSSWHTFAESHLYKWDEKTSPLQRKKMMSIPSNDEEIFNRNINSKIDLPMSKFDMYSDDNVNDYDNSDDDLMFADNTYYSSDSDF